MDRYTTKGDVCGSCDHAHRSIVAAQKCADRHHAAIVRGNTKGAYSDRKVVRVDGEPFTRGELYEIQRYCDET